MYEEETETWNNQNNTQTAHSIIPVLEGGSNEVIIIFFNFLCLTACGSSFKFGRFGGTRWSCLA